MTDTYQKVFGLILIGIKVETAVCNLRTRAKNCFTSSGKRVYRNWA